MKETRNISLDVGIGDKDSQLTAATVVFCESSASLTINKQTIHIPWTELAAWQMWLAEEMEKSV